MLRKLPLEEVLTSYKHASLEFREEATETEIKVKFTLNAFLYKQQSIVALWMELNRQGFLPRAKTVLGRIRCIIIKNSNK